MRMLRLLPALACLVLAPAPAVAKSTTVIRLVSITTSARAQDLPPQGLGAGDTIFTTSRLENAVSQLGKPRGAVVGHDRGTIRLTGPNAGAADGIATLPGGTIHFRGPIRVVSAKVEQIPVVGGTGRFAGARGTLTTTLLSSDGVRSGNIYRLTLP